MAPTTINKNSSQWAKPGPKTSPSTDTAPPIGKYGCRQLNTISLLFASETLHKEAREGMTTTHITNFFRSVSNQRNTATEMETDGIAILVSDSEPEVLDGNNSHLPSLQEGLMITTDVTESDDGRSWISVDD